jgi:hypothetical protein
VLGMIGNAAAELVRALMVSVLADPGQQSSVMTDSWPCGFRSISMNTSPNRT